MGASVSQDPIVSFDDPPVVEVVASVQFGGLSDSSIFSVGSHWADSLRSDFPGFSLQPPYDVPEERFQGPKPAALNVQFGGRPPLPRLWLSGDHGGDLMQIQQDWFALNWRKVRPHDQYDRWPKRRAAFERHWGSFRDWAASLGDTLTPKQFEVTYVNHVRPIADVWSDHPTAGSIFSFMPPATAAGNDLERFTWSADYVVQVQEAPQARVHVSAQPGYTQIPGVAEPSPIVILEITARGPVREPEHVLTSLDLGRNAVVRTFVDVTSDEAKSGWGVNTR